MSIIKAFVRLDSMRNLSWRFWGLAGLSGVLQVLSFPLAGPILFWRTTCCWFALVPLLWCLVGGGVAKPVEVLQGALLGYVSGIIFYLGNCYWIFETMSLYGGLSQPVAGAILVLFCFYLGLYHALFAALLVAARLRVGRRATLLLTPFLWVAIELARTRVTGFPWDLLGISQVDNTLLIRLAPFGGAYALSFVIAAVNILWLVRWYVRQLPLVWPILGVSGIAILGVYVADVRHLPLQVDFPPARATLVQENLEVGEAIVGPEETIPEKLAAFSALSRNPAYVGLNGIPELSSTRLVPFDREVLPKDGLSEAHHAADVIIWPESPAHFRTNDPEFQTATSELAKSTGTPLILGSLGVVPDRSVEAGGRIYDSAALILGDGSQVGRYDKIHLVPFGEYVPFKSILSFASKLTAGAGDMDRGAQRNVFEASSNRTIHRFGIFVCYESIFGDEVRQFVRNGAEVLVNISDDGWYGDSGAAWQHLNMARMRAIENHRWVLRAANTGITASIDPSGRVVAALPRRIRASISVPFGYERDMTFYTRHGDWFAYFCVLVSSAILLACLRPRVN